MPVGPFRLSLSTDFKSQVHLLSAEARKNGELSEFVATLEFVNRVLKADPDGWGDPLFHYHGLRIQMHQGIRNGFWFYYGVHLDQPVVFLERIRRIVES